MDHWTITDKKTGGLLYSFSRRKLSVIDGVHLFNIYIINFDTNFSKIEIQFMYISMAQLSY